MSYKPLLSTLYKNTPVFDTEYAILSAPVRHIFMIASIWYLRKQSVSPQPLSILEIGSWYGASALSWVQGLVEHNDSQGSITCVDAWEPFFDMEDHKDEAYAHAMEQALVTDVAYEVFLHNIRTAPDSVECQHFRGKSERLLPQLRDAQYDVVFIDADHTYNFVSRDIDLTMRLVREGGIICGDDLNLQLHECDEANAQEVKHKDFVKDPKTGRNFHPGVTLAVAERFGKVSSWGGFWAMQKQQGEWKPIALAGMPLIYPKHFPADAIERAKDHFNDLKVA